MRASILVVSIVLGVVTGFAAPARSGQVRVLVAGNNVFQPNNVSVNLGDHVVWFWVGGLHTVTQGTNCTPAAPPLFDTGAQSGGSFSWKSTQTGAINYFCGFHCAGGMVGVVNVSGPAAHALIADFRITELRRSDGHENDYVEIANVGDAQGQLGRYRLSVAAGAALEIPVNELPVNAGSRVVLHFGQTGSDTGTDIYFPSTTLPASGSAALYVPNTNQSSLAAADMMIDYVEWGSAGHANETTAGEAGVWTPGEFVSPGPAGVTIEFCGEPGDRGAGFWAAITAPNPGVDGNCTSPAEPVTWGGLKVRFR